MSNLERRVATVVAADVVGFSRLVSRSEDAIIERLLDMRHSIIDPAIEAWGGRVVKTTGDGLLVEFNSPFAALDAARQVQTEVTRHEAALREEERIRFRVGINHGSVLVDGDDVLGDVVNIAARLETLAPPGGICVSRSVHDMIGDGSDLSLKALGRHFVRNIPSPIDVWQVRTGVDYDAPNLPRPRADRPSLIVLPFDNRSFGPR